MGSASDSYVQFPPMVFPREQLRDALLPLLKDDILALMAGHIDELVEARVAEELERLNDARDSWIGAREAAEHLGLSYKVFSDQVSAGEWPSHRDRPGGNRSFLRSELDKARRLRSAAVARGRKSA